jgi:rhodanese-related sulfurtransferase
VTPEIATAPAAAPVARLTDRFPPHPDKPFVEVSGTDVEFLHGHGTLVLDARRTSVYEEGHIAGARSFPIWEAEVDRRIEALVNEGRDTKQPVVVYCTGGDCEDSHMLAQKLFGAGFENALVYRDGWPDWLERGGASRQGALP